MADAWDDEELLAALRQAHRARQAVPPEFVEAAKSAFAWHNIDAELAQLTYDSYRAASHGRGDRDCRGRDRLLLDRTDPLWSVPPALQNRCRHRRPHEMDHFVNPSAAARSASAQRKQ